MVRQTQHPVDHHQRNEPDRDVHVEDPAPPADPEDVVLPRQEAAHHRPEHARRGEDRHEVAHVARAFLRRHDVGQDGQRQREQPARAEPLERTERGEHVHRRGETAQRRPNDEDHDRDEEERLAAVDVRQLAVKRGGDGRGDQERRGDPGLDAEAVEIVPDAPDGGGDDGLVERGQEHAEQQPGEDRHDLPMGQRTLPLGRRLATGWGGHQDSSRVAAPDAAKNCGR